MDGSAVDRSCRIPFGVQILLPVINGECSVVEDNSLQSRAALRACATSQMDLVTVATAKLDGHPLQIVRRQSRLFSITLPEDNVLGIGTPTPNPSPAVAEGFWVRVGPLPAGHHVLTSKGTLVVPGPGGFTFTQDVKYDLEIVPPQFVGSTATSQAVVPSGAIPLAVVPSPAD